MTAKAVSIASLGQGRLGVLRENGELWIHNTRDESLSKRMAWRRVDLPWDVETTEDLTAKVKQMIAEAERND